MTRRTSHEAPCGPVGAGAGVSRCSDRDGHGDATLRTLTDSRTRAHPAVVPSARTRTDASSTEMTEPVHDPHEMALQCAELALDACTGVVRDAPFVAQALAILALFWQKEAELNPTDEYLRERARQAFRTAKEMAPELDELR